MNAYAELKTVGDFIRYATSCFNEAGLYFGHGTDNAWDEALALILPTLHLPHNINPVVLNANVTKTEHAKLVNVIEKRINQRIPVPYLTHQAWFAGLNFYVDERVLIPRSPIAELIEQGFIPWHDDEIITDILDMCTGSGCIAVATAKYLPNAHVDASDISQDALAVAKINVLKHDVEDQVTLIHSDLFANIPLKKYDIIISDPPYVTAEEMAELPPEYKHEPEQGLSAGPQGLDFVERILHYASDYLKSNGILIVEVGNAEQYLSNKFPRIPFTWLEFTRGGGGVFMLTAKELNESSHLLKQTE